VIEETVVTAENSKGIALEDSPETWPLVEMERPTVSGSEERVVHFTAVDEMYVAGT
jgi:hypothetical protein